VFKVDSHYTARHDKILLYGFDLLEITLAGHRLVMAKVVSFTLEENILPVDFRLHNISWVQMQLRFDLLFPPLYNNKAIQAKFLNESSLTISYETTVSKTSLTQKQFVYY